MITQYHWYTRFWQEDKKCFNNGHTMYLALKVFPTNFPSLFPLEISNHYFVKNSPMFPKEYFPKCFPNNSFTVSLRINLENSPFTYFPQEFPFILFPKNSPSLSLQEFPLCPFLMNSPSLNENLHDARWRLKKLLKSFYLIYKQILEKRPN